ncbi:tetratricopeptide repeat protein [bacterium]|nr:tetratricopeptide repeat protein [bacterium]
MLKNYYKIPAYIFAAIALTWFMIPQQCAASDDPYTVFVQANQVYKNTNYSKAILLYNKAISLGFTPGSIYYNLGNAYYRNGKLGKAIVSYLKARQLLPRDSEVIDNLNIARAETIDNVMPEESPAALRQFLFLYYKFSLDELLWGTAVLIAILFISLSVYAFLPFSPIKRIINITAVILIIIGIAAGTKFYNISSHSTAVVVSKEAIVRAGPGDSYAEIFVIHNGTEVKILKKEKSSAKIRVDKKKGWINIDDVDII